MPQCARMPDRLRWWSRPRMHSAVVRLTVEPPDASGPVRVLRVLSGSAAHSTCCNAGTTPLHAACRATARRLPHAANVRLPVTRGTPRVAPPVPCRLSRRARQRSQRRATCPSIRCAVGSTVGAAPLPYFASCLSISARTCSFLAGLERLRADSVVLRRAARGSFRCTACAVCMQARCNAVRCGLHGVVAALLFSSGDGRRSP